MARTHIKQQPLLQHLLDIAATHYSLLQASSLLDQFNSPLLNRIPFWQEKLESLTRMLRLSVNLPARQLMAQFDSTLRFWMGAQEVLLLRKHRETPDIVYPHNVHHCATSTTPTWPWLSLIHWSARIGNCCSSSPKPWD